MTKFFIDSDSTLVYNTIPTDDDFAREVIEDNPDFFPTTIELTQDEHADFLRVRREWNAWQAKLARQ